jgi:hypothetical protein
VIRHIDGIVNPLIERLRTEVKLLETLVDMKNKEIEILKAHTCICTLPHWTTTTNLPAYPMSSTSITLRCICPKPGTPEYNRPWMGVCPAHTGGVM